MIRRLFTFIAVVSLVTCVAVCALWVRSFWVAYEYARSDDFSRDGKRVGRVRMIYVGAGGIRYEDVVCEDDAADRDAGGPPLSATFVGWRRAPRPVQYPGVFTTGQTFDRFGFKWSSSTFDAP